MKKSTLILFILLFTLHLPFLTSDPDTNISFSRDAFTDEGLYTSQVRNYLITGEFNLNESDAAVKTPLFSALMLVVFAFGGIHLLLARLAVLLISLLIIYFVFRKDWLLAVLFGGITLMQYTVFHYNHIALSEFLCVACLAGSWHFMTRESFPKINLKNIFLICVAIAMSWYFKFQFLYMIVWPIVFYFLVTLFFIVTKQPFAKAAMKRMGLASLITLGFCVLYYLVWYLPSKSLFDFVLETQASAPFGEGEWFWKMINHNIENYFINLLILPYTALFLVSILIFPFMIYKHRSNNYIVFQMLGAFSWCLLELYKPALGYLPGRYLVSTFFAMGLFSCVTIRALYLSIPSFFTAIAVVVVLAVIPVCVNFKNYFDAFSHRSYLLRDVNNFVAENSHDGCAIVGPWAPAISWKTNSPSLPVWKDYFNDKNTMSIFQPCIVVSELDEEDSGNAWKEQGVNLEELAVKTTDFKIHNWHARVYVLKK